MCGIYATNLSFTEDLIKSKLETIQFRGLDSIGFKEINEIKLGHLRLSIVDLDSRSNQPMVFNHLSIVFNGEVYNFLDLKEELIQLGYEFETTGDTEVLLKGYAQWGEELFPKLIGMFAFVIYDSSKNTILSCRDRLGVKPFYYFWDGKHFEICSQLRPISENKEINKEAISIFLECGYVPSPYSIFNQVYKLLPGHTLHIDLNTNELRTKAFWDLKQVEPKKYSKTEAKEKVRTLLFDAVKIRLNSDVPIGCFLSGGIDSALVTSIATKLSASQIKTFTIGFENPKYDESKIAEQFAQVLRTDHTTIPCTIHEIREMIPYN